MLSIQTYANVRKSKRITFGVLFIVIAFFAQCSKSTTSSSTNILNQDKYKIWQLVDTSAITEKLVINNPPRKYDLLKLKIGKIKSRMKALEAKEEVRDNISYVKAEKPSMSIELPFPYGNFYTYHVENSSLFSSELAKKFPDIRSYSGYQKDNEAIHVRLDINPSGLFAMITSPSEIVFIRPIEGDFYICYKKSDVDADNKEFYEPQNKK